MNKIVRIIVTRGCMSWCPQIKTFRRGRGGTRGRARAGLAAALHAEFVRMTASPSPLSSGVYWAGSETAVPLALLDRGGKKNKREAGRSSRGEDRRMQQQMAATVEEQMMVKAIREESPWEVLPKRIQAALVSKEEWHRRYVNVRERSNPDN